jgi:hypothetical protein
MKKKARRQCIQMFQLGGAGRKGEENYKDINDGCKKRSI